MANTPSDVKSRARLVKLGKSRAELHRRAHSEAFVYEGETTAGAHDPQAYRLTIELYPTEIHRKIIEAPSLDLECWCRCTCPYWKYYVEVAVMTKGSTDVKFAKAVPRKTYKYSGLYAKKLNPRNNPYLCKHLYHVMDAGDMIKKFKDVVHQEQLKKSKIIGLHKI